MSTRYDCTVLIGGVDATAVFNKMGGPAAAQRYLADELLLVEAPKSKPPLEPVLDFIIRVDRFVKPTYLDWMKKVMHPELELAGPAEYDLSKVEQWLHDDQKRGSVVGNTIYKHLQKGDALATCLNLQDGLVIQQVKGITVFRKLFTGKAVFLWGSVVQHRDCGLHVPYLYGHGDKVGLNWFLLDNYWYSSNPALRFSK